MTDGTWRPKAEDTFYWPSGNRGKIYNVSEGVVDISPDRNVTPIQMEQFAPHPNGAPNTWIVVGLRSDFVLDAAYLAARCKELSENPAMDAAIAEKAHRLKEEWLHLAARGQSRDYKENDRNVADEHALTIRMAAFLVRYSPEAHIKK